MIIRYVDLFAGIGGFRKAVELTALPGVKFLAVAACEIDQPCRDLYTRAFPEGEDAFPEDVQGVKVRKRRGVTLPPFDLIFAGFPCQAFANVGSRTGLADPRGALFFEIVAILDYYQPDFFILENVQKMATIRRGNELNRIKDALEGIGYHLYVWDLTADEYGLPQRRRRLFFCGCRNGHTQAKKVLAPPRAVPRDRWEYPTVWHLLERSMDPRHIVPERTRHTVFRRNPKWMGDLEINRPIARPLTATMGKWHRANQDNYYSKSYVQADNPNPYCSPPVDWETEEIRRITPLEGFRLQGFPDSYWELSRALGLPLTTLYRLIGNAVPVNLAAAVTGHFLGELL